MAIVNIYFVRSQNTSIDSLDSIVAQAIVNSESTLFAARFNEGQRLI